MSIGVTLSDLQSLLEASESRTDARLTALSASLEGRFKSLEDKLDPLVREHARYGVRIDHLESQVDDLNEAMPEASVFAKGSKFLVTALVAGIIGAFANKVGDLFPSPKQLTPTPQHTEQPYGSK